MKNGSAHAAVKTARARSRVNAGWSTSWLVGTTVHRTRAQWRLLASVLAVALLASVLVTSLGLLITATEQGGVRGALGDLSPEQTALEVRLIQPHGGVGAVTSDVDDAVSDVFAPTASSATSGIALTRFASLIGTDGVPAIGYLGELDGIEDEATLTGGEWAPLPVDDGATPVTLPASAAAALNLQLGDEFTLDAVSSDATLSVVGFYEATDASADYWENDFLHGAGNDSDFQNPAVEFYQPVNAFGPAIVAKGGLDVALLPISFITREYQPQFTDITVDELPALLDRLGTASLDIPLAVGGSGQGVFVSTNIGEAISTVAASLVVTRSTVVVVSLLLVVLAVAAMAQTARLFTDARAGERQLLRARGASGAHILGLAVVEALLVGLVVALVSPPLAALVYRGLATQPAMVAAGMPGEVGVPLLAWITAAAIGLVFVMVIVAPLARRSRSFVDGEQSRGRQRAASGIMRSGIDVVVVLLAGIAFWQLQSYRSPLAGSNTLSVDLVLAAGPALVLIACALVCVRAIPAAARVVDQIGSSARGIGVSLAAWEVGRRSQRATSAVLLLSLTLAVGTFGLSFLATWTQSQRDQASFAIGAPVRVSADDANPGATAEPVIRRWGVLGPPSSDLFGAENVVGSGVQVIGLSAGSRQLLDSGRLSEEGGSTIRSVLDRELRPAEGIVLPDDTRGISATMRAGNDDPALAGVLVAARAIVETDRGVLITVDLGTFAADGQSVDLRGEVSAAGVLTSARLVGLQTTLSTADAGGTSLDVERPTMATDILVSGLGVVVTADDGAADGEDGTDVSLEPGDAEEWTPFTTVADADADSGNAPEGWQLRLGVIVPSDVTSTPASYALVGWTPLTTVPAVVSAELAGELHVDYQTVFELLTSGAEVGVTVATTVPHIPGAATADDLESASSGLGAASEHANTVVLDQALLSRALAQAGVAEPAVDEWWVDVPAGEQRAYGAAHDSAYSVEGVALDLQQAPLRVATQAALWLAIIAAALLAAVGFATHSSATLRNRRLELAQLRAIGFSRRRLIGLIGGESLVMAGMGTLFGVSIGLLLAWLVGPLVAVSPDGGAPLPSVVLVVPWLGVLLLVAEIVAVLAVVVLVVARVQRFAEPAELLREGGDA